MKSQIPGCLPLLVCIRMHARTKIVRLEIQWIPLVMHMSEWKDHLWWQCWLFAASKIVCIACLPVKHILMWHKGRENQLGKSQDQKTNNFDSLNLKRTWKESKCKGCAKDARDAPQTNVKAACFIVFYVHLFGAKGMCPASISGCD